MTTTSRPRHRILEHASDSILEGGEAWKPGDPSDAYDHLLIKERIARAFEDCLPPLKRQLQEKPQRR